MGCFLNPVYCVVDGQAPAGGRKQRGLRTADTLGHNPDITSLFPRIPEIFSA
jgi:hypothetical protein